MKITNEELLKRGFIESDTPNWFSLEINEYDFIYCTQDRRVGLATGLSEDADFYFPSLKTVDQLDLLIAMFKED